MFMSNESYQDAVAVVNNPNAPIGQLEYVADLFPELHAKIILHPNTTPFLRQWLLEQGHSDARKAVQVPAPYAGGAGTVPTVTAKPGIIARFMHALTGVLSSLWGKGTVVRIIMIIVAFLLVMKIIGSIF